MILCKKSKRNLHLHEYQAKTLLDKYGVHTQRFRVIDHASDATQAAQDLKVKEFVVKAQIHAGGRGKGSFTSGLQGGVQLTRECVFLFLHFISWLA